MRLTLEQLDSLIGLLDLFEKDETIKKIIETDKGLEKSIHKVKNIALDILI